MAAEVPPETGHDQQEWDRAGSFLRFLRKHSAQNPDFLPLLRKATGRGAR
ncbi:hypothetical protein [Streptomyces sp. NPDC053720]